MIDAHAHLHDTAFDNDRDAVVLRARSAGVERIITIGTDVEESWLAIACAEQYDGVYASVGVHPHVFREESYTVSSEVLRALIRSSSKVVAIGECGLDYFSPVSEEVRATRYAKRQREGFLIQIALAQECGLPLIVHTRPSTGSMDAYEEVGAILKETVPETVPVILHCYMGDRQVTETFLALPNVYFSLTGNITYAVRTGSDRDEVLGMIPLSRVLTETDCPYLAPVPYRGKRNEPAYVSEVLQRLAVVQQQEYEHAEAQVSTTVQLLFPRMWGA